MFYLGFGFDNSRTEYLSIKSPFFSISSSDDADAVIEDFPEDIKKIEICRGIGDKFSITVLNVDNSKLNYQCKKIKKLSFNALEIVILSHDLDLFADKDLSYDQKALSLLRKAVNEFNSDFPAIQIVNNEAMLEDEVYVSIPKDIDLVIGRSKDADIRLFSGNISREHSKIRRDDSTFYISDLESTNGTFLVTEKGFEDVKSDKPFFFQTVKLGESFSLKPMWAKTDVSKVLKANIQKVGSSASAGYLYSNSSYLDSQFYDLETLFLQVQKISIGRGEENQVIVNGDHISTVHCVIFKDDENNILIRDQSSNGTIIDQERMLRGDLKTLLNNHHRIDLNGGIILEYFRKLEDLEKFRESQLADDNITDQMKENLISSSMNLSAVKDVPIEDLANLEVQDEIVDKSEEDISLPPDNGFYKPRGTNSESLVPKEGFSKVAEHRSVLEERNVMGKFINNISNSSVQSDDNGFVVDDTKTDIRYEDKYAELVYTMQRKKRIQNFAFFSIIFLLTLGIGSFIILNIIVRK